MMFAHVLAKSRICTRSASTATTGTPKFVQPLRGGPTSRQMAPRHKRARKVVELERAVRKLGRFPLWDSRALGAAASRRQHAGQLRRPDPGNPKPDFTKPPVKPEFLTFATRTRNTQDLYFSVPPQEQITQTLKDRASRPKPPKKARVPPSPEYVKNLIGGE